MDTEELERPETNFALRTVPAFSKRSFGRSSKRATDALPVESRAIAGLEERSKAEMAGSVAMALTGLVGVGLLGGGLYHSIKKQLLTTRRANVMSRGYFSVSFPFVRPFRRAHLAVL